MTYTFKKVAPNLAESDTFSVCRVDRDTLRYKEYDHFLDIEVEIGDGLAIYASAIRCWSSPNDSSSISEEKKKEIIERVCAALDFLKPSYRYQLA